MDHITLYESQCNVGVGHDLKQSAMQFATKQCNQITSFVVMYLAFIVEGVTLLKF